MSFDTNFAANNTYYDLLDIPPSATPSEVRDAYLRAKSAFNKDSVALYSLIDTSERESMLHRIEEAYEILSNEDKRRQYDSYHGIIETTGVLGGAQVVSIDRVPPMEVLGNDELLVPPTTDIGTVTVPNPPPQSLTKGSAEHYAETGNRRAGGINAAIMQEILDQKEWPGSFLRKVREAQSVSLEEMSNLTKISKTYIQAIETEDFKKLPAPVFVRGFLVQIFRILKLPQEKALEPYLQRFNAAKAAD